MDSSKKPFQDAEANSLTTARAQAPGKNTNKRPYFEGLQQKIKDYKQNRTSDNSRRLEEYCLGYTENKRIESFLEASRKSATLRRVATQLIPPKFKEQGIQTQSKCKCTSDSFYIEMMCSERRMGDYYRKTSDQLEEIHLDLNDDIAKLRDDFSNLKKESETIIENCHDLRGMIEMGTKVKDELIDYDKNVEKIIADDSGVADVSASTSQCENEEASSSDCLNTSTTSNTSTEYRYSATMSNIRKALELIKAKTDLQVDTRTITSSRTSFASTSAQADDSWPKISNTFSRGLGDMYGDDIPSKKMKLSEISKRKEFKSRYVQVSTCCFCDYTESEQMDHIGGREVPNEFDCMYNAYNWRSGIASAIGVKQRLEIEISDLEKKLPGLRRERARLREQAEACEQLLQQACHTFVVEEGLDVAELHH